MRTAEQKAKRKAYDKSPKGRQKKAEQDSRYYEKNKKKIKAYVESWRKDNWERARATRRISDKAYYEKHKAKILIKKRIAVKKWRLENPEKYKAHNKAHYIKIPKGQICVGCNHRLATDKHHEDYDKPLEVIFLCRICHSQLTLTPKPSDEQKP